MFKVYWNKRVYFLKNVVCNGITDSFCINYNVKLPEF